MGRTAEAWRHAQPTFQAKILGPHFEELARDWAMRFASEEAALPIGTVGSATISDPAGRTRHEIDVLALAPGVRPNSSNAAITLIGEAKATVAQREPRDLERLEHLRGLLTEQGHQASDAVLALFSLNGFRPELRKAAARRQDVMLVDTTALYGDTPATRGA